MVGLSTLLKSTRRSLVMLLSTPVLGFTDPASNECPIASCCLIKINMLYTLMHSMRIQRYIPLMTGECWYL